MYRVIKKYITTWIRPYSILPLIFVFSFNCVIYWVTMFACKDLYHYDFTLPFDRSVPFVPEFVYIYLVCYVFWAVNYIMSAYFGKDQFYRFVTADLSSRVICLLFFIILPTTNVRPELPGDGITMDLMRGLYAVDMPVNLLPSIHCLVSWFCFIAIRGRKEIPTWYRCFSCIFALMVVASTQFIKQHYIVDAIAAIVIAEGTYFLSCHFHYYTVVMKLFEKLNDRLKYIVMKTKKKID